MQIMTQNHTTAAPTVADTADALRRRTRRSRASSQRASPARGPAGLRAAAVSERWRSLRLPGSAQCIRGSGREIARLVELHAAYRWLCGGVAVAYHRLNDFRSDHGDVFSELVTQLLARLMKHDLIDLHRVAQDGTRIRASAGAASFRSGEALERLMLDARAHLVEVTRAATDPALTAHHAATMARVAQDRLARLEHALAELPDVAAIKKNSGAKDATPRVSTTDPDARGCARCRPAPAGTTSSRRSPATELCPARSQPTRGRRLIDAAPTRLRSRPARRTMPTL